MLPNRPHSGHNPGRTRHSFVRHDRTQIHLKRRPESEGLHPIIPSRSSLQQLLPSPDPFLAPRRRSWLAPDTPTPSERRQAIPTPRQEAQGISKIGRGIHPHVACKYIGRVLSPTLPTNLPTRLFTSLASLPACMSTHLLSQLEPQQPLAEHTSPIQSQLEGLVRHIIVRSPHRVLKVDGTIRGRILWPVLSLPPLPPLSINSFGKSLSCALCIFPMQSHHTPNHPTESIPSHPCLLRKAPPTHTHSASATP